MLMIDQRCINKELAKIKKGTFIQVPLLHLVEVSNLDKVFLKFLSRFDHCIKRRLGFSVAVEQQRIIHTTT